MPESLSVVQITAVGLRVSALPAIANLPLLCSTYGSEMTFVSVGAFIGHC
jgi:hypothetical protein